VLYTDWWENSQSYFHTLQALDVSPTCDAADVKSIIQLFPHSSQHVTGNSLSDVPLQIIDISWQWGYKHSILHIAPQKIVTQCVILLYKFLKVYTSFWITLYKWSLFRATLCIVLRGVWSSYVALLIHFLGLLISAYWISVTLSSDTKGLNVSFLCSTQPVSKNLSHQFYWVHGRRMLLSGTFDCNCAAQ
jgi:hypothetical protein